VSVYEYVADWCDKEGGKFHNVTVPNRNTDVIVIKLGQDFLLDIRDLNWSVLTEEKVMKKSALGFNITYANFSDALHRIWDFDIFSANCHNALTLKSH
jgi:hypothetical protein